MYVALVDDQRKGSNATGIFQMNGMIYQGMKKKLLIPQK